MKKISDYYGMQIYSDRAHRVGVVKDVVIDDREGAIVGLALERKGGKVTSVPYNVVTAVGDIVLVRSKKPGE